MAVKRINVNGGQITLQFPEDVPRLHTMLNNITKRTEKAYQIITQENENQIDRDLRRYSAAEFEKMFGPGSCKKTFGTEFPSYKAFFEFTEKICDLVNTWY
ncbi:MAG: hypothetical protein ACOX8H_09670 [Ruminococcus sp.]|jgi:hypothetical protein